MVPGKKMKNEEVGKKKEKEKGEKKKGKGKRGKGGRFFFLIYG